MGLELDCKKCDELKTKGYEKEVAKVKKRAVEMAKWIIDIYEHEEDYVATKDIYEKTKTFLEQEGL